MKWLLFIFTLLACTVVYKEASGRAPKVISVSESEVTTVNTALGYTTMLQFDSRPTSAVLGDQDGFRVEYVGTGLAIKPIVPHSKTNLFIFTDYDRFNFRLVAGPAENAEYVIKVKRKGAVQPAYFEPGDSQEPSKNGSDLIIKNIINGKTCDGIRLQIDKVAWTDSKSNFLVQFRVQTLKHLNELRKIQAGDFEALAGTRSLPIETLHLSGLEFSDKSKTISGTLVLKQTDSAQQTTVLKFSPDFISEKNRDCLKIKIPVLSTDL